MDKKLLKEEFVKKARLCHGETYDYSEVIYNHNNVPVTIICKDHGKFDQRPRLHVCSNSKGVYSGCPKCGKIRHSQKLTLTNEQFVEKANLLYNNYYNYDKLDYKGTKSRVIITCPVHGDFEQRATNHLEGKGCQACGLKQGGVNSRSNTKEFIQKAKLKHGDKYGYSKSIYTHSNEPIIITCKIHGDINTTPFNHLQQKGCTKCFREQHSIFMKGKFSITSNQFIEKANLKHNFKYDYSLVDYISTKKKVKIICPEHGIFEQVPSYHLAGNSCRKCANYINSFNKNEWIEKAGERLGIFYILKCWNETEEFFKLGITFNSIKYRYSGKNMPYNYEIIKEVISEDLSYIWELEKRFKLLKKKQHYKPLIEFSGSMSECFKPY